MALALKAEPSLIGTTTPMQLAIYADSSSPPQPGSPAWQTVSLRVVAWPNVATPKHLVTAITDGPTSRFQDLVILAEGSGDVQVLSAYRRLGLSVYPRDGANSIDPAASLGRYFFPENRTGPEWKGLRYGLEHDTFEKGFNGDGLFCLTSGKSGGIGCPVNESQLPQGLSPSQRALELSKWAKAVDFFNQTSQLDIAYDGFMLHNSFENLRLITSAVQPFAIFTDAEHFPTPAGYQSTIAQSKNAQARRRPGETDCALAERIAVEFLSTWMGSLGTSINFFYGDTPQSGHGSHGPWSSEMLAKYGEKIVPQFGLYNAQASYRIDVFARWIRINKEAHQARGLRGMVPWVTTGFDGTFTASDVLSQAVHLFAGGATGFNVFCTAADGDWDSWANM